MRKKADKLHQPPTPSFVATFELEADSAGFAQLEKQLNAYRQVSNATLGAIRFPERNYSGMGAWINDP